MIDKEIQERIELLENAIKLLKRILKDYNLDSVF